MFKHFFTKIYPTKIKFRPIFNKSVCLISKETLLVSETQIIAVKKYLKKYLKKKYKVHFCLNFRMPVTTKPIGSRMGKGKGNIDTYCYSVSKGQMLFEIGGEDLKFIINVLKKSKNKFNFDTVIIVNDI